MPKVITVEEPKHGIDIETTKPFGELTVLFGPGAKRPSVFKPSEFGAAIMRRLEEVGFDADRDWFALTGSMVVVSTALACMMARNPAVNILLFSSIESKYVGRRLDALEVMKGL